MGNREAEVEPAIQRYIRAKQTIELNDQTTNAATEASRFPSVVSRETGW